MVFFVGVAFSLDTSILFVHKLLFILFIKVEFDDDLVYVCFRNYQNFLTICKPG